MNDKAKPNRPKARVAKGFRDIDADEIRGIRAMLATIQRVYESYGFEPVEQPFIEYTDALGKFLPDQDRPNAGVFSFQDEDEQWLSLRYDLTAPLARFVAENNQGQLPSPYRSYRQGWVFRNEKPGPGRFRQFMQFDADTVGSASPAADAEVCMMAADTMEALGIPRGQYVIKVNHRKLLDALMQTVGLELPDVDGTRLTILRAMDKFDKLREDGVRLLLGKGRTDSSGDFTKGAGMDEAATQIVIEFLNNTIHSNAGNVILARNETDIKEMKGGVLARNPTTLTHNGISLYDNPLAIEAIRELDQMRLLFEGSGYGPDRIKLDSSIIRGLEYYTGPVFECELLMDTKDEDGNTVRFGSVGGGGRYDDLVARFTGQQVPATGFSIGVSRLYSALKLVGKATENKTLAPVVVTVMDKDRQGDYWKMVQALRNAKDANGNPDPIRAEMYVGTSNMGKQMKYADKRGAPLVVIQGGDEKAAGQVQIKDLRLGSELAANIATREEYASQRLAQVTVPEAELVAQVRKMLAQ
jgi:histidyl-tRNA synthetase